MITILTAILGLLTLVITAYGVLLLIGFVLFLIEVSNHGQRTDSRVLPSCYLLRGDAHFLRVHSVLKRGIWS